MTGLYSDHRSITVDEQIRAGIAKGRLLREPAKMMDSQLIGRELVPRLHLQRGRRCCDHRASTMKWIHRAVICTALLAVAIYCMLYGFVRDKTFVTISDTVTKKDLVLEYHRNLASVPRHKFKAVRNFKSIGSPVSSVMAQNGARPGSAAQVKTILAWTTFFGSKDWIPKTICSGEKICVSTSDKSNLPSSDGIVIHPRDLAQKSDLPTNRLPHQRFIYLVQESPWSTGIDVGDYDNVFNWTSTYRRDSDFPYTFFWTGRRQEPMAEEEYKSLLSNILSTKKKLIAYMNSNCQAAHTKRLDFVRELNQHVNVDMYGKCGNLTCPRGTEVCTRTMSEYKFYLALENTNCRDYLTEKVHQPLIEWHAVPVVMGGADPSDYETILPPHSYVHTSGFSSTRDLVDYLLLLDRNPELYGQYHAWRRTHQRVNNDPWCEICKGLHNISLPVQTYTNFKGWYREDVCLPE